MADLVRLSVSDGIAWLVLNRPQVLNALDQAIVQEYAAHVLTLRERKDVRVILTRGEGRGFCAGSDLHELSGMSAAEAASSERRQAEAFALLDSLPQPTIALTHGYALGGGLQVALYHDFHLTTESTTLGLPEVELGWTPPWALGRLMDVEVKRRKPENRQHCRPLAATDLYQDPGESSQRNRLGQRSRPRRSASAKRRSSGTPPRLLPTRRSEKDQDLTQPDVATETRSLG